MLFGALWNKIRIEIDLPDAGFEPTPSPSLTDEMSDIISRRENKLTSTHCLIVFTTLQPPLFIIKISTEIVNFNSQWHRFQNLI